MPVSKGTEANLSSDKLLRINGFLSANHLPARLKGIADRLESFFCMDRSKQ